MSVLIRSIAIEFFEIHNRNDITSTDKEQKQQQQQQQQQQQKQQQQHQQWRTRFGSSDRVMILIRRNALDSGHGEMVLTCLLVLFRRVCPHAVREVEIRK